MAGLGAKRLALLAALLAGVAAFFALGGHHWLSFERLVDHKDALLEVAAAHPAAVAATLLAAYLALGVFSLPGSTVLNVAAGLLFDFREGLALAAAGSLLATTVSMGIYRYLLADLAQAVARRRFAAALESLRRGGALFVITLRLLPFIPFSMTNLVLAASPVPFWPSQLYSALALLPRQVLYAYAGTQLGDIDELQDLWSWRVAGVLLALAVIPAVLRMIHKRKASGGGKG